jgi:hypothetical protein
MAAQVILTEDGNLGPAGTLVWVDDPSDVDAKPKKTAAKKTAASKADDDK